MLAPNVSVAIFLRRALKAKGTIAMKLSCGTFRRLPTTYRWEIDRNELDELMATKKKNPLQVPMRFYIVSTGVLEGWALNFLCNAYKHVFEGGPVPALFAASRTVFIPKSSGVHNNGRIVRSMEALRPLTP